jgi:hypothetical protein
MAVLGVIKGFNGLPDNFRKAVEAIGDSLFIFTNYSFNKAVNQTMKYATDIILKNGGIVTENEIKIRVQPTQPFALEVAFPNLVFDHRVSVFEKEGWVFKGKWDTYPPCDEMIKEKVDGLNKFSANIGDEAVLDFNGTGISVCGNWSKDCGKADIFIDGVLKRTIDSYFLFEPQPFTDTDLYHITSLQPGKHTVLVVVKG